MTEEEKIKLAQDNKDIPISEIQQDIEDTQREINDLIREAQGLRIVGDRMSKFRADNREIQIQERKEFIEKLEAILYYRR